jgi:DNA-binding transcriptional MerR regulator
MEFPGNSPRLRIGELSRRLGISDHVLRAWQNRYGLPQPVRSPGGFRLFSEADERRIRRMQAYLADRLSAAGASTPVEELERAVDASHPGLVVLAATRAETLEPLGPQLASLARRAPLALAGAGATVQLATAVGARLLTGDPVTEAGQAGWPR